MANQVTVTAKIGPGRTDTAIVLGNVTDINFNLAKMVVTIIQTEVSGGNIKEYDLVGVTAVTFTISGSTYTVVIS